MKRTHDPADGDADSPGSTKRRKPNPKGYLVAEFAKEPIKIDLSPGSSTILGRTNEVLAPHLDAFVSRNAASVEVNAEGDATLKVNGSNPVRYYKAATKEFQVLKKGNEIPFRAGDYVELTFNPVTQIGRFPIKLLVVDVQPITIADDVASLPNTQPEETAELHKEITDWLAQINPEFINYTPIFVKEGFSSLEDLMLINFEDLNQLGISKLAHKHKIFNAIQAMQKGTQTQQYTQATQQSQVSQARLDSSPNKSDLARSGSSVVTDKPAGEDKMVVDLDGDDKVNETIPNAIELDEKSDSNAEEPAPPPPPPPPKMCEICDAKNACVECAQCAAGKNTLCFICNLSAHKSIPADVDAHKAKIIDPALMQIQRKEVEDAELEVEKKSIEVAKNALKQIAKILLQPIGTEARMDQLRAELHALEARCTLPETIIVVMGDTGAGKSTTLNAILGEESILPTNGMRACTAVIIEMRHSRQTDTHKYIGEVEFLTREEWNKELDILISDMKAEDGRMIKKPDPRSQAGIALAKIKVVYGNVTVDQIPTLKHVNNHITRALGSTQTIKENQPRRFKKSIEKYADSNNNVIEQAYWPLVKRISLRGPWEALHSGAVLVDAPGVRDDNSARDAVVKSYLRDGNSIWIVANIKRAVNDRTAKDMLGESFRRQLLMDGQYGSLAFIATHADVVNRSELIENLRLADENASRKDCAKARNAYTKKRIKEDFHAGLEEMALNAGISDEQLSLDRFYLPVFTVSSMDYQKLIGHNIKDGPPETFDGIEDTEIPAICRYVYDVTLRRRYDAITNFSDQLMHFLANVEHLLTDDGTLQNDVREAVKKEFNLQLFNVQETFKNLRNSLEVSFTQTMKTSILNKLPDGIKAAENTAEGTVVKWGLPVNRAERSSGGLHFMTYRATCRRNGMYSSPTAGMINFNEELSEPIYRLISVNWDNFFAVQLQKILTDYSNEVQSALSSFNVVLGQKLAMLGVEPDRIEKNLTHQQLHFKKKLENMIQQLLREDIQAEQREANRLITPEVQVCMTPCYTHCGEECGTGCYQRIKDHMFTYVSTNKKAMFTKAANILQTGLLNLAAKTCAKVSELHAQLVAELGLVNQVYWEVPVQNRELRLSLVPTVKKISENVGLLFKNLQSRALITGTRQEIIEEEIKYEVRAEQSSSEESSEGSESESLSHKSSGSESGYSSDSESEVDLTKMSNKKSGKRVNKAKSQGSSKKPKSKKVIKSDSDDEPDTDEAREGGEQEHDLLLAEHKHDEPGASHPSDTHAQSDTKETTEEVPAGVPESHMPKQAPVEEDMEENISVI